MEALDEAVRTFRRAAADLADLLAPVACAACGGDGGPLCGGCAPRLAAAPRSTRVGGLTVWSGLEYSGEAARVIRALKDGSPALARIVAPALAAALSACAREREWSVALVAVPVPARARSLRTRGYRVVERVMRAAGVRPRRLLRLTRQTADQRGLDRRERAVNQTLSMRAAGVAGRRVIVVDDVITTGATLREAARAVAAAGGEVVAAATIAATPRRRADRGDTHSFRA